MIDFFSYFLKVFPLLQIQRSCSQDHTPPRGHLQAPRALSKEQGLASSFLKHYLLDAKRPQSAGRHDLPEVTVATSLPFPGSDNCSKNLIPTKVARLPHDAPRESELSTSALSPVPEAQADPTTRSVTFVGRFLCDAKHSDVQKPKGRTGWERLSGSEHLLLFQRTKLSSQHPCRMAQPPNSSARVTDALLWPPRVPVVKWVISTRRYIKISLF